MGSLTVYHDGVRQGSYGWNAPDETGDFWLNLRAPADFTTYGSYGDYYYNHKVPVINTDPSGPTVSSYNTTTSHLKARRKWTHPTWNVYTDIWGSRMWSRTVDSSGYFRVYSETGNDANLWLESIAVEDPNGDGYWVSAPDYSLPSQPVTYWTQNNYRAYYNGSWHEKAPGSSNSSINIWEDVTWSTSYSKLVYTATLDKNGGTDGTSGPIYWWANNWYSDSSADTQITSITKPTKTGYDFGGYKSGNTLIIDSDGRIVNNISGNVTLVAQWTAHPYTVHFDKDGNITSSSYPESTITPSTVDDIQVTYDGVYPTLPILERYGFDFDGWVDDEGNPVHSGDTYNPDSPSNHTLHAKWTIKQFTIRTSGQDGIDSTTINGLNSPQTLDYYSDIRLSATLSQDEPFPGGLWVFGTWSISGNVVSEDNPYDTKVIEDTTYIARGSTDIKRYTITLTAGEGVESVCLYDTDGAELVLLHPPYRLPYGTGVMADVIEFTGQENAGGSGVTAWTGENDESRYRWEGWRDGEGHLIPVIPESREHLYRYKFTVTEDIDLTAACRVYPKITISLGDVTDGQIEFTEIDERWDDSRHRHLLPFSNPVWHGTQYSVRAIPNPGKMLQYWLVGNLRIEPDPDNWNILTRDVPNRNVTVRAVFDDWTYIWHHDGEDIPCHWNEHYIFIKTDDPTTPWKVVKEIKINTNNGWVTSSRVD